MTAPGKITHCVDLNGSDGKQAVNPPFALEVRWACYEIIKPFVFISSFLFLANYSFLFGGMENGNDKKKVKKQPNLAN